MRITQLVAALLFASVSAVQLTEPCEPALDVSQEQLDKELYAFSTTFDKLRYKQAMMIYRGLQSQGKDPKMRVNTWEYYDKAFSFPRVRRYGLVQEHMDLLEHF